MYKGSLVELGSASAIFQNPQHAYTRYLLKSNLSLDPAQARQELADLAKNKQSHDFVTQGQWLEVEEGHFVLSSPDK